MKATYYLLPVFIVAFPFISYAAPGDDVLSLWNYVFRIIERVTQLFWVLSVLVFLWGIVEYLKKQDSPAEQTKAKQLIIHSVIAFTIAISFWAFVTYVINSAQLDAGQSEIPKVYAQ